MLLKALQQCMKSFKWSGRTVLLRCCEWEPSRITPYQFPLNSSFFLASVQSVILIFLKFFFPWMVTPTGPFGKKLYNLKFYVITTGSTGTEAFIVRTPCCLNRKILQLHCLSDTSIIGCNHSKADIDDFLGIQIIYPEVQAAVKVFSFSFWMIYNFM